MTTLADVWGQQAPQRSDVDWIRWAAAHRRVAFTADESIRYLRAKRDAVLSARLQVFCFPHTGIDVAEQVRRAVRLAGSMRRLAAERPGPWLAVLYDDRLAVSWPEPPPAPRGPEPSPEPRSTPEPQRSPEPRPSPGAEPGTAR